MCTFDLLLSPFSALETALEVAPLYFHVVYPRIGVEVVIQLTASTFSGKHYLELVKHDFLQG